jgi:hypothetical protein
MNESKFEDRPQAVETETIEMNTACGKIYITIGCIEKNKPYEMFIRFGKAGGCGSAMADSMSKMCSYALRLGMPLKRVIKAFAGQSCHHGVNNNCLNQISQVFKQYLTEPIPEETYHVGVEK